MGAEFFGKAILKEKERNMATEIKSDQTMLFIGDSITDCGRRTTERPLGNGYVKLFADMLTIREPEKRITIINKGIDGDRVTGLQNRWSDDVLRHKPDWLSIKIGINDLHSVLFRDPDAVTPERYQRVYEAILSRTRKTLSKCEMLLIEPFYISTEQSETSFRRDVLNLLPEYLDVIHAMSQKYDARLVKTHELFRNLLKYHEPDIFCPEPVHPNLTGHLVIAEAIYAALSA